MAERYRDRPFPTDNGFGHRSGSPSPQQSEGDPLAELARLIGQTDPFSSFGREQPSSHPEPFPARGSAPDAGHAAPNTPSWLRPSAQDSAAHRYGHDDPYHRHDGEAGRDYEQAPPFERQERQPNTSRYDQVLFGQSEHDQASGAHYDEHDHPFDDDAYGYHAEDQPRAHRGKIAIIAVLTLAVLGTAGAYAYRSFLGAPRSGEPPIIKADAGPNKVAPPTQSSDGSGKLIYDRVGSDKGNERVVSREEQPVDINARPGARVAFPPLTPNANPPTAVSSAPTVRPTGSGIGNGIVGDEPKKIRTLSIRGDQPDTVPSASASPAPATPAKTIAAAPVQRPAGPVTASARGNEPISLVPKGGQTASAPAERAKVAALNPATQASISSSESGAYVQLSSQRSETEAQASFKALQGKYPGILGSRAMAIKRADLGDKGVYYRAMVGPFKNPDDASQFCTNLKSAGGQCIVQRN